MLKQDGHHATLTIPLPERRLRARKSRNQGCWRFDRDTLVPSELDTNAYSPPEPAKLNGVLPTRFVVELNGRDIARTHQP